MREHALALLDQEETFFLQHSDAPGLLLELAPLLERLRANPTLKDHLDAMERESSEAVTRLRATDDANIERLKVIRADFPIMPPPEEGSAVWALGDLRDFDRAVEKPSSIGEVSSPDDRDDPGKAKRVAFMLRVALREDASKPDPTKEMLHARIKVVEEEQAHAFRDFSVRRRTMAGFSLQRLLFVLNQINPRPEHHGGWDEYLADRHRTIFGEPEILHDMVHGGWHVNDEKARRDVERVEQALRREVRRVCGDLRRRVGSSRSRVALVNAYALRCSWYDAPAMAELAKKLASKTQKEDPLSDHLARFLFDYGLRPLTRAMVGRLVPDIIDPSPSPMSTDLGIPEPAFYVEAKQFIDKAGARKAVRDGSRQIWSSADRIRKRYSLDEAFLVVFRRGGPLLRFPDSVTSGTLTVRPVLVDVAGGTSSGSRQGEVIHVKPEEILAELAERANEPAVRTRPARKRKAHRR